MKKICLIFLFCFNTAFAVTFDTTATNSCNNGFLYSTNNLAKINARFEPNSHTCGAGYFLPANTDACRACPSGYTCPGGTFVFNEHLSQGINKTYITSNVSNGCSDNLLPFGRMRAKFIPNETITVNFNNGETVETVTCVYDTALTLPEPPSRVGYTFAGWKVHTEQQN